MDDELYTRLEQFVEEAQSSRKEAYEESVRRKKAEKDAIDAFRRVSLEHCFLIFCFLVQTRRINFVHIDMHYVAYTHLIALFLYLTANSYGVTHYYLLVDSTHSSLSVCLSC